MFNLIFIQISQVIGRGRVVEKLVDRCQWDNECPHEKPCISKLQQLRFYHALDKMLFETTCAYTVDIIHV